MNGSVNQGKNYKYANKYRMKSDNKFIVLEASSFPSKHFKVSPINADLSDNISVKSARREVVCHGKLL